MSALPTRTVTAAKHDSTPPSRSAAALRRVALVEDHALLRSFTAQLISSQRDMHVVFSAESLTEFTAFWARSDRAARPDVLILGPLAGRAETNDLSDVERLVDSGLKIVLFSALIPLHLVQRLVAAGIRGVIGKRDTADDVVHAVRTVLTGGEWHTPELSATTAELPQRPALSAQEERALVLYSTGLTTDAVASSMGVQRNTVKKYLQRVKQKYAAVDREVHNKIELSREAAIDGYLDPASPPPVVDNGPAERGTG